MKYLFIAILLARVEAHAVTQCELFDNEQINNLTSLSVPNCLTEDNIFEELDSRSSSTEGGVICGSCQSSLVARVSIPEEDKKRLRKQAYLEGMFAEYKKTMSALVTDMMAVRKLYSTGSDFSASSSKCSAQKFQDRVKSCSPFVKNFLASNNADKLVANEISSMLSNQPATPALLQRGSTNQCSITDQEVISLKPLLLERIITKEMSQAIAAINPTSSEEIWLKLSELSGANNILDLIKHHPILKSLSESPSEFISFFRNVSTAPFSGRFEDHFRRTLYTKQNGDKFDGIVGQRCEQALNSFASKVCSSDFENANISLGPIEGFERNNNDRPFPENDVVTTEESLARNFTLIEFCNSNPRALSLAHDTTSINDWMKVNDRRATYNSFANTTHREYFTTPKEKICSLLNSNTCSPTSSDIDCRLRNLYQESKQPNTLAFRLANNPDPGVNQALRAFVGTPVNLSVESKRVLIAEGILPDANGQFVERPEIPERRPEYLAGVANGTITPNSGSGAAPTTTRTNVAANRNSRTTTTNQQTQISQAGQFATNEFQVGDQDDQEALRRFQDGLDERLRRIEGQDQPQLAARTPVQNSRQPVRTTSRTRTANINQPSSLVAPSTVAQAETTGGFVQAPSAPTGSSEASLDRDTSRQTLAQRQANAARAQMFGARTNPAAAGATTGDRSPASTTEGAPEAGATSLSLTVSGDIRANLERALNESSYLSSVIAERRPFRFKLNNSLFDVNFSNGVYTVAYRSGRQQDAQFATDLQNFFNSTLSRTDRSARLTDLQRNLSN